MQRDIEEDLALWKEQKEHLPLLIRGARQVGKTFTVEKFGKEAFPLFLEVNFEIHPEYKECFNSLDPEVIIKSLELISNQKVTPGETLLFLDEIQECPNAIIALRYFKERMPDLHVIGAGSLLEFVLNDESFSFPVGRVQFMRLGPLSFREFLRGLGHEQLCEQLPHYSVEDPPELVIHEHLLKLVREYFFVGGMPAVVKLYKEGKSLLGAMHLQDALCQGYRSDFGKYAKQTQHKYLQKFYERSPYVVAHHFQYKKIDPDMRSRDLKIALEQLCYAGLLHKVFATSGNGMPLEAESNERKFKVLYLDIGLLQSALQLQAGNLDWQNISLINDGPLAEQFVGQELLAYQTLYQRKVLHFWERKHQGAEVDYLIVQGDHVVPIEVKSGVIGKLKSLKIFMKEKGVPLGVRVSQKALSQEGDILSLPFYLISEHQRIISHFFATL